MDYSQTISNDNTQASLSDEDVPAVAHSDEELWFPESDDEQVLDWDCEDQDCVDNDPEGLEVATSLNDLSPSSEVNSAFMEGPESPPETSTSTNEEESGSDGVFWKTKEVNGKMLQVRLKRCEKCDEVISLGNGRSLHAFHQHQHGARCSQLEKRKISAANELKKQKLIADMFRPKACTSESAGHPSNSSISIAVSPPVTAVASDTPPESQSWGTSVISPSDSSVLSRA
jgi:hypothetical protein